MVRLTTISVTFAALLAGAAVAAQDPGADSNRPGAPDADAEAAAQEDDFDPTKIVCRRVSPPTGTRVTGRQTRQRMCMSRADWEQQELDAQEALKVRDEGICSPRQCNG